MKVLSLFDWMSCWRLALQRAWIIVDTYMAAEIDKYAMQISQKNFPEIVQLWNVNNWKDWNLWEIDIIIGGSPCQWFSFAWKQLAFDDPRSKLFFTMVDIIKYYKPKYFLLENVKMKKEYQNIISQYLWVQPIEINSALVSAQNRKRLYRTNIPWIIQPEDQWIILKDIIESWIVYDKMTTKWKSYTITASYNGAVAWNSIERKQRTMIEVWKADLNWHDFLKRVYHEEWKCPTLTAVCWWNQERKIAIDDKTWRKLTPVECERLQTVPDNYTEWVSNSQRYKMLGNWRTIDIISHIFSFLPTT